MSVLLALALAAGTRVTAADFMDACAPMVKFDQAEFDRDMERLKSKDVRLSGEDAAALIAVTYCPALISGITTTLAAADHYQMSDGARVCVDPQESGQSVLRYVIEYGKAHPQITSDASWDAESFVLTALRDRACPTK